jgi:uncharacterized membrane protein YfcA
LNEVLIILLFLTVGYLAGILVGMFGIGGGIVFVPFLYYFLPVLGVDKSIVVYSAIGTSLLSGSVASTSSAYFHLKAKNAFPKIALLLAAGSVLTAFITPFFVVKVQSRTLEIILAAILFLIAVRMFFEKNGESKSFLEKPLKNGYLIIVGLFVGVLSAFTGLGGGVAFVPALVYLFLLNIKNAIGTSSIVTALTMISSAISFLILGGVNTLSFTTDSFVYIGAAIPLGFGAMIGSKLGVKLTLLSRAVVIRKIFSVVLILAILRILIRLY